MNAQPEPHDSNAAHSTPALRRAVAFVALANLAYFCVEYAVARSIGSVSLFADSIDFLEDASVNLLIFLALSWSVQRRARLGMLLAVILLIPALAMLWTLWQKLTSLTPPAPLVMSATGIGALAVNLTCALVLARFHHHRGSLTRAAFLSARNDAYANLAIIGAGLVPLWWSSPCPDIVVGIGIAAINADAARSVWKAARAETARARA